jgi:hypothetical protein
MENKKDNKTGPNQESEKLKNEVRSVMNSQPAPKANIYQDTEKDLNAKILKVTLMIQEQFPELSKYLEEMPVTIPNAENPNIELENLKKYYNSLTAILDKYKLEHTDRK